MLLGPAAYPTHTAKAPWKYEGQEELPVHAAYEQAELVYYDNVVSVLAGARLSYAITDGGSTSGARAAFRSQTRDLLREIPHPAVRRPALGEEALEVRGWGPLPGHDVDGSIRHHLMVRYGRYVVCLRTTSSVYAPGPAVKGRRPYLSEVLYPGLVHRLKERWAHPVLAATVPPDNAVPQ
jgi:hypothetical protein